MANDFCNEQAEIVDQKKDGEEHSVFSRRIDVVFSFQKFELKEKAKKFFCSFDGAR